jgi:hypothetical protein
MDSMEFTWRMATTLVWPLVVLIGLLLYRVWITTTFKSLRFKFGSVEAELNTKVDTTGRDIASTLAEMPELPAPGVVPTSLVDLMPLVTRNRSEGIHAAFDLVQKALKDSYPQLRRVPPSQLTKATQSLVDSGLMDDDVAVSVKRLHELLQMPEWNKDSVGDTRGYAFLMLAEGAIHGILRGSKAHGDQQRSAPESGTSPVRPSWRGIYNDSYPVELSIRSWDGGRFSGIMRYPDSGTVTLINGRLDSAADQGGGVALSWEEQGYESRGRRAIDFDGSYQASVSGDTMTGGWHSSGRLVARFELSAFDDGSASVG